MEWTLNYIKKLKEEGKILDYKMTSAPEQEKKKSKYRNETVSIDGKPFDSRKESLRYKYLNQLLKAGQIGMLARQVEFELNVGGSHSMKYIADFVYLKMDTGAMIVEDVKGMKTREYKKKKKLMQKVHGIEINEL